MYSNFFDCLSYDAYKFMQVNDNQYYKKLRIHSKSVKIQFIVIWHCQYYRSMLPRISSLMPSPICKLFSNLEIKCLF